MINFIILWYVVPSLLNYVLIVLNIKCGTYNLEDPSPVNILIGFSFTPALNLILIPFSIVSLLHYIFKKVNLDSALLLCSKDRYDNLYFKSKAKYLERVTTAKIRNKIKYDKAKLVKSELIYLEDKIDKYYKTILEEINVSKNYNLNSLDQLKKLTSINY